MVKPIASKKTLASLGDDPLYLVELFKGHSEITVMPSDKLLVRSSKKQRNLNVSGDKKVAKIKKRKDIPANSLQDPSYWDATDTGHKSQGYKFEIIETQMDPDDKMLKAKTQNLITHVHIEKACQRQRLDLFVQ